MKTASEAFPRSARLLKHEDFERVYKSGQRHFSANMSVFYLRRAEAGQSSGGPRVGLTVGRALGGAVARNRIKRRMRAAVRKHLCELPLPVDVVINPRKSAGSVEFARLTEETKKAFSVITSGRGAVKNTAPRA